MEINDFFGVVYVQQFVLLVFGLGYSFDQVVRCLCEQPPSFSQSSFTCRLNCALSAAGLTVLG
ncbi:hypothetical protein RA279_28395, partial [Pseudomonas syringae pv. tagetis]|uniref:hypothetical protein n=1 Tax=Pseudomonas syringae group genomosp. 7 TaxID=251699 RepID=UPI00376FABCE